MKKTYQVLLALVITAAIGFQPMAAIAADSVRVSGQVGTAGCPAGFQYSAGVEVNVSTNEVFTICNAPPNDADLLVQQQDADFRSRQDAAVAAATAESQAWNAANPGQQKCVQWGPIIHANGVSTASGGVCANPVTPNNAFTLPTLSADSVDASIPVATPDLSRTSTDAPFVKEVDGQVGKEGCPSGYQGANGVTVDTSTGKTTTQCWTTEAWQAWVLGGTVWEKYQSSGGAYDVAAEVDRRAKLAALKQQAHSVAQAAADGTPGVRRCSAWTGYGESGEECAYSFIVPPASIGSSDSLDSIDASAPKVGSSSTSIDALDPNVITVSAASITTARSFTLINVSKKSKVVTKSLTPKICSVANLKVKAKALGTCVVSYKSTTAQGKVTQTKKSIIFTKSN